MAEILVRAIDNFNVDPEKDRTGSYKRGYPVFFAPDSWGWGRLEGPPGFVRLIVPDLSVTAGDFQPQPAYNDEWKDNFDYSITTQSAVAGRYTINLFEINVSATGLNGIAAKQKANAFLDSWNCSNYIITPPNSVQFDFALNQAIRSDGFWDVKDVISYVTFNVVSYDSASGVGRIQVTVDNTAAIKDPAVQAKIISRGGAIVSAAYPAYQFDITRLRVLQEFWKDIKARVQGIYCRRRYYVPESIVAAAEANGGTYTILLADLQAAIKDKLQE